MSKDSANAGNAFQTIYPLQVPGLSVDPLDIDPTAETIQPELKKLRTV